MSYIEILMLRNLSRRPAHGYELRKRVEAVTGVVLNNNSLYPALRRFEEAGAVTRTAEEQPGRPPRQVYELTDVGRSLLHDLLADLPPESANDETEFLTRLGQFTYLTPPERLAVLDARVAALGQGLVRLAELRDRSDGEFWSTLVTAELAARAERERSWLHGLRELAADGPQLGADGPQLGADSPQLAADSPQLAADSPQLAADGPRPAPDGPEQGQDRP
jgi:DNA-binding PadR family transcriptional regulator